MKKKVVYLFGAGASHACVEAAGCDHGTLMGHLAPALAEGARDLLNDDSYRGNPRLEQLVNAVVTDSADYEQLITFLDQSPSHIHRNFADRLRQVFERVLSARIELIRQDLGTIPVGLYEALLDMYNVEGFDEELGGLLTLNYDEFVEAAIGHVFGPAVDFGVTLHSLAGPGPTLLKLHGSFGWQDRWPIKKGPSTHPLWIPPGIHKTKDRYPFNLIWGLARELLNCDIVRIVGCRLSPNDWDLISLLFSTRHTNIDRAPYRVECIGSPHDTHLLKKNHPYLDALSIFELDRVGEQLVGEYCGGAPRRFDSLTDEERTALLAKTGNWFRVWLKQMAEALRTDLGSVETRGRALERLLLEP